MISVQTPGRSSLDRFSDHDRMDCPDPLKSAIEYCLPCWQPALTLVLRLDCRHLALQQGPSATQWPSSMPAHTNPQNESNQHGSCGKESPEALSECDDEL